METCVVTGMAASTPFGVGVRCLVDGLGSLADAVEGPGRFREPTNDINRLLRVTRTDHPLAVQLLAAIDMDLGHVVNTMDPEQRARTAVALGNCTGNVNSYLTFFEKGTKGGYRSVNPVSFPSTMLNFVGAQVSNAFGLTGANTTVGSGPSAGLEAIGYAATRIELGRDTFALAGGVEELNVFNLGYGKAKVSEAVGILFLQGSSSLDDRKALAIVLGHACSKGHPTEADGEHRKRAVSTLNRALAAADVDPRSIDAVFPSFSDSVPDEACETHALREVFGGRLSELPIYAISRVVGQCLTASGPLQCIAAIQANHTPGTEAVALEPTDVRGESLLLAVRPPSWKRALVWNVGPDFSTGALVLANA